MYDIPQDRSSAEGAGRRTWPGRLRHRRQRALQDGHPEPVHRRRRAAFARKGGRGAGAHPPVHAKREVLYGDDEYADREKQLHRHALYHVEAGDIVVVDARGDMQSGIFGEMMLTYFAGKGGAGMVVDGVIRDAAKAFALDIGYWMRGTSPNFHTQTTLMPHAVNVPIACGGTYVRPGDIIIADDDGAVCVRSLCAAAARSRQPSRRMGRLLTHDAVERRRSAALLPLAPEAEAEYQAWKAQRHE